MGPVSIGIATYGGALSGMWISRHLPSRHLGTETRDAISLSMAIVGTLAALVLSLLLTQASASFAARANAVTDLSANVLRIDRALQRFGPAASDARISLRQYAGQKLEQLAGRRGSLEEGATLLHLEDLQDRIDTLRPTSELQQDLKSRAVKILNAIMDDRWLIVERQRTPVPAPFLALLVFWLTLLFASFALFAPRNGTIFVVLLFCALAVSGGVYLILEMGTPTRGLIRTPLASLATAVRQLRLNSAG